MGLPPQSNIQPHVFLWLISASVVLTGAILLASPPTKTTEDSEIALAQIKLSEGEEISIEVEANAKSIEAYLTSTDNDQNQYSTILSRTNSMFTGNIFANEGGTYELSLIHTDLEGASSIKYIQDGRLLTVIASTLILAGITGIGGTYLFLQREKEIN